MDSPDISAPVYPARYGLVDALRGCAALAVVCAHVELRAPTAGGGEATVTALFSHGYEAVLIFFVISGYCIGASAQSCARKGFAFREFMWRRIRRIYPPYLCAIAFWIVTRLVKARMGGGWDLDRTPVEWLQNLTLTQWVSLLWDPINSPICNPRLFVVAFWSLCYEEQFYLVIAVLLLLGRRYPGAVLHGSIALAVLGIAWNAAYPTTKFGIFLEYWAAFATGLLAFYRLCVMTNPRAHMAVDLSLAAMAIGCGVIAWGCGIDWGSPPAPGVTFVLSWSSLSIAATMALLLIAARPLDARYLSLRVVSVPLGGLAAISYSLYLTHQFCLGLAGRMSTQALGLLHLPPAETLIVCGQLLMVIVIATVFWHFCERPFSVSRRGALPSIAEPASVPAPIRGAS